MNRKFAGEYKEGKPVFDKPEELKAFFQSQKGRFEATFEKESEDISKRQRGYYFGVLIPVTAKQSGHTEEEVDGVLHRAFLTVNKGTPMEYVRSTAEGSMNKEEYASYLDKCIRRLTEHGLVIPEPNKELL